MIGVKLLLRLIPKKKFNPNKTKRLFAASINLLEALQYNRKAFMTKKEHHTPANIENIPITET